MSEVERTWRQWAGEVTSDALTSLDATAEAADELFGTAAETAKGAVETAVEASGVGFAIDYWESHDPATVTANFREAVDESVSEQLGPTAGKAARVLSTPVGAAARFSTQAAQGVDSLVRRGEAVLAGRAPMPSPGEVVVGVGLGAIHGAKNTIASVEHAATKSLEAIVEGDIDGFAEGIEDGFKAGADVGALVLAGRGVASGSRALLKPGGAGGLANGRIVRGAGGAAALQAAFNPATAVAGGIQVGASTAGLATVGPPELNPSQPLERRNIRRRNRAGNEFPRGDLRGVSIDWLKKNKPSRWKTMPSDNGKGFKWVDTNGIERFRFMRPNKRNPANSEWSRQANGYMRWTDARGRHLDIDGNLATTASDELFLEITHIIYEGPL